ncbi:MAG TPA: adenylate/guanylate cyclase domain-containing protein [Geminicoccus sp.]|uniref:adenylate/guanylate cyclase domain-containing protein n=1 Tax=Geminicoccus sp. TaxID=2024832 RepID=UPI002C459633|nr:adenylate/guanylate cyclase domain-containing protein [Geminicoccus sp.]HWL70905.1 adenylate/guanylate cyclase domain-containing protein [Geminicoccus sp.]
MAAARVERRLAAILAADVVGYSRLMERDEGGTFERLKAHRKSFVEPLLAEHRGRIVKLMGDGALCEFASVVDAVACAVAIQRGMAEREAGVAEADCTRFRIGVNLGDLVVDEDGDLYGDGVNVAARLEQLCDPGGVFVSGTAHDHLRGKLRDELEYLGERQLKGIERPVRVYRAVPSGVIVPPAPPLPDRPSIAVLPFDNMSADPEQAFFADGITEDLTTALSRLKGFLVIARNTMFTYKGRTIDVRAVGRELGVRYVLEGSVRTAGRRVRVTAQLIEAASGNHLWADHYDRPLDDIFAIQDEITASVVGCIGPELLAAEHARAGRKTPQDLDAWECVVRALFRSAELSDAGSRDALALLDRAIARDPGYAQAFGMRARIVVWRAFQGWEEMGPTLTRAKADIARALAADKDEPWAYLAQGMVAYATRDEALAMAALTRAVALNPNSAYAHGQLSIAHTFSGRADEAVACIDHAVRLSPREIFLGDYDLFYAFAHFQAARYELGLRHAREAHRWRPGHPTPLLMGAACAGQLADAEAAAELLQDLRTLVPGASRASVEATIGFIRAEDRARLVEGLARAGLD